MSDGRYSFLIDTYRTERLKTLSVWAQIGDDRMHFRPEPRARTPREHMIHQCLSEDAWMSSMLGIETGLPVLPADESRLMFLAHYAETSERREVSLIAKPASWFEDVTTFFDVKRSRAWVLVRRIAHSAHHRGQLTSYLRLWGGGLFSTYGPTADTGGLAKNGALVIYRYASVDDLLEGERSGARAPMLPGPGASPATERGD
jgi:uncharacterized damage-inducible protein DinB